MRLHLAVLALALAFSGGPAAAVAVGDSLSLTGYFDTRLVSSDAQQSWLEGGLGKFRYGAGDGAGMEVYLQADNSFTETLHGVLVLRAEPRTPGLVDATEAYLRYDEAGADGFSWSAKAGAFYPDISLENDDLGWASPYTLTPSAINSWVGDELRSIGSEITLRRQTAFGTISFIGAIICCNDEAGILIADRGWSLDDRPTGLLERVREPVATMRSFHLPDYARTGMFDEMDGRPGWYAGASWRLGGIGKLSVLRYDNEADPAVRSQRDTGWDTRFWAFGGHTALGPLSIIAQGMIGRTVFVPTPSLVSSTGFRSAFLLASYDWSDWRLSLRGDVFQTRRAAAAPSPFSEDGSALTAALSWTALDNLRLMGEVIMLRSRRAEYLRAGLARPQQDEAQFQFDTRFSF
jgi:hypothetical protein